MKIKKMLLKLYVPFLMFFFSLVVSVLLFGTSYKAANNYDQLVSDLSARGINISNNNLKTYWETYPDKKVLCYLNSSNNAQIVLGDNLVCTQQTLPIKYTGADQVGFLIYRSDGSTVQVNLNSTYYPNGSVNSATYVNFYDGLGGIDWDNPYYSANIQSPNVNITYREFTSVPTIDVPLNVTFLNDLENYYFESFAIFCQPETVMVTVENGQYVYDGFFKSSMLTKGRHIF